MLRRRGRWKARKLRLEIQQVRCIQQGCLAFVAFSHEVFTVHTYPAFLLFVYPVLMAKHAWQFMAKQGHQS
jgi:hypothetical protein